MASPQVQVFSFLKLPDDVHYHLATVLDFASLDAITKTTKNIRCIYFRFLAKALRFDSRYRNLSFSLGALDRALSGTIPSSCLKHTALNVESLAIVCREEQLPSLKVAILHGCQWDGASHNFGYKIFRAMGAFRNLSTLVLDTAGLVAAEDGELCELLDQAPTQVLSRIEHLKVDVPVRVLAALLHNCNDTTLKAVHLYEWLSSGHYNEVKHTSVNVNAQDAQDSRQSPRPLKALHLYNYAERLHNGDYRPAANPATLLQVARDFPLLESLVLTEKDPSPIDNVVQVIDWLVLRQDLIHLQQALSTMTHLRKLAFSFYKNKLAPRVIRFILYGSSSDPRPLTSNEVSRAYEQLARDLMKGAKQLSELDILDEYPTFYRCRRTKDGVLKFSEESFEYDDNIHAFPATLL